MNSEFSSKLEIEDHPLSTRQFYSLLPPTARSGNILVNDGKNPLLVNLVGGAVAGGGTPAAKFINIGSSQVVPAATQGSLGGFLRNLLGSFTAPAGSAYFRLARTFGPGTVTATIQEWAIGNKLKTGASGAGSGHILNRGTVGAITKAAADSLAATTTVTFS